MVSFFRDFKLHLLLASLCLVMVGCAAGDQYEDIKAFMREVEAKPLPGISALPEFEPYQPFTYGASNRRSPFEAEVVIPQKSDIQRQNIGVKPPRAHVKQYLERFSLASLQMVGYLKRDDGTWALVEDDTGGVHRVQVGDFMGSNWGKIESINDTRIDVTEIVSDGASGWLRRPRSIELKSVN
ncbi:MAG: type IV pilus assembly protein PilP [Planctomycetaceae bacterium]